LLIWHRFDDKIVGDNGARIGAVIVCEGRREGCIDGYFENPDSE